MKYLVSACLVGVNCRYDGKNNLNPNIKKIYDRKEAILVCPEQLGGLSTPRVPCERLKNKVIDRNGIDRTKEFYKGAKEALLIARKNNIMTAIMKKNSPSCGKGYIYDGSFSGKLISGNGVCIEVLEENGIKVLTEDDF